MKNKALFLDRDGVINKNHGYVYQVKNFDFIDGIFDFTKTAIKRNYEIFVITNQAGIGRGYYSEKDFLEISEWMVNQFSIKKIKISKVYYSPYHPEHGLGKYKLDHPTRKPNPGMIEKAADEFNIDLSKSVLVGDQLSDICAGKNAKVKTNILFENEIENFRNKNNDFISVQSFEEAKKYLI